MKSRLLLLLFVFTFQYSFSQDFSNKGTDFWIAYPSHIDGTNSAMGIYITSDVNASGQIKVGSTVISFTVAANSVTRKFIGPNATGDAPNTSVYLTTPDGIQSGAGIQVTSDKPVAVYSHIIRSARSAATLVLPTKVWGKKYIVPSYKNVGNGGGDYGYGEIAVMASEANTTLRITPSVASRNGSHPAGTPFDVVLANPGDIYQLQFNRNSDISGTKVESIAGSTGGCKPITVFSATTWSAFDCTSPISSGGDNLYQQLFPTGSWGKQFLVAPFKNRSYDIVKVFVDDPTTVVTKTENGIKTTLTGLTSGYYEFKTSSPVFIEADKPVSLVQFMVSQSCDSRNGLTCGGNNQPACPFPADPEMVVINPVEQTISNITVFSAHRNFVPQGQSAVTQCFLNIIIKNSAISSFKINNQAPTGTFIPIPSTSYSYLQEDVTNISLTNPVQTLTADSGFIAVAYGYGQVESYGYNAGTNVKDLYQYVTLQNQYAIINEPATCKNTPFFFSITLPYQPTSITWDFNNNPNLSPNTNYVNNAPVPDSTFIKDGKTLYMFKQKANSYTFSATGVYPIKVIVNNQTAEGCPGIQEINYDVNVYDPPVTDFSLTQSGCVSDTTFFTDATNGNNRPVIKWRWDFGDGTVDSVKNPKKVYTTPGNYNVKLFSITDVGCINEMIKPVVITTKPQASFTHSANTCSGSQVTFTDASTVSSGTIIKWIWTFGNGIPAVVNTTGAPVNYTYTTTGTYTATLQVETSTGCKSTIFTKDVVVNANPVVDFTFPAVVCLPVGETQFINKTTISDASTMTYNWNFGDNQTSTDKDPLHKYTSAGPFDVKLTATSTQGCTNNVVKSVNTILPQPKANFVVNPEVCLGDSTVFIDQSNGSGSNIVQWKWTFGDGGTSTLQNPKHLYATASSKTVTLSVITDKGCISDTMTKSTIVNPLPVADFTTSSPTCETKEITITDKSLANAGTLNKWSWNFGDGTPAVSYSSGTPFTKTYTAAGNFSVKLDVETDKGCKHSVTKPVTINPQPTANIILPEVCLNDAFAQFLDSSFIVDGSQGSFTYLWNFGDNNASATNPNTSTLKDPRHKYAAVGMYKVSMTVTSKDGCSSTITRDFTVNGSIPVANFNVLNSAGLCSNTKVEIQNTSSVDFGAVTKVEVLWDAATEPAVVFTDDNPSPNEIYSNSYPALSTSKDYQVKLRAFSGGTCVNETTKTISVSGSPKVSFTTVPSVCIDENAFQITQASESGGVAGSFTFTGKGVSPAGLFTPSAAGVGQSPIKYTYTTNSGCKDSASQIITVLANPKVDAGPDLFILEGGSSTINAKATGNNLSFLWSPSTYLSNPSILNPTIIPLADITYKLTVTGEGGCAAIDQVFVKVLVAPEVPNAFSPNKDGINDTWNIQFLETYPGAIIEVFNRYGQLVYKSTGYPKQWDGTYNGVALPVGVYYYIINPKNGRKQLTGSVTILK
ncbi:MAG TPA: PKD domain-containing protein [Segetibacter sp.]